MKKKQPILKLLKNVLTSSIIVLGLNTNSFSQDYDDINIYSYNDLYHYFNNEFELLLSNYINKDSLPLTAKILDTSNPIVKDFINHSTRNKNDNQLAMHYFPLFKVKNIDSSFCLIFYNSKENIFSDYEKTKIFSKKDALQYLAWHEMGHCFAFHEKNIREGKKDEAIADSFAISLALSQNNPDLAFKIIKEIKLTPTNDIHSNGDYLQNFLSDVVKEKFFKDKLNINDILKIIFYYNEHQTFQNFKIED